MSKRVFFKFGAFEYVLGSNWCFIGVTKGNGWTFKLAIPYLFAIWLTIGRQDSNCVTEWSLGVYEWFIMFFWGHKDWAWKAEERGFCWSFNIKDALLGLPVYESTELEKHILLIPMPEKSYKSEVSMTLDSWKRPRWFKQYLKRIRIEIPEGIPYSGKGENAWDCGERRTSSYVAPADDMIRGVGMFVGYMLQTRVRYGGWKDWDFKSYEKN